MLIASVSCFMDNWEVLYHATNDTIVHALNIALFISTLLFGTSFFLALPLNILRLILFASQRQR
jgi:hypothetical protein